MFFRKTAPARSLPNRVILQIVCRACEHNYLLEDWDDPETKFCFACKSYRAGLLNEAAEIRRINYFKENPPT